MLDIVNVVGTFGQNICGSIKKFWNSWKVFRFHSCYVDIKSWQSSGTKNFYKRLFSRHFPHSFSTFWDVTKMCDWTCNGPLIVHFHTKVKRLSEQISRGRMEWPTFLFHVKIPFVSPTGNTVTFCKFTFTTKCEVWNKKENRKDERSFKYSHIKFMNGFECST